MTKFPFKVKPLEKEDRSSFDCGTNELNEYFAKRCRQDVKRRIAHCFIAVHQESGAVAGFYTLSASQMLLREVHDDWSKRLPKYPTVPSVLLGRLAIDVRFQKQGLGGALLGDAASRVIESDIAAHMFLVDAKDENAMLFYQYHGFRQVPENSNRMSVPITVLIDKLTP